MFVATKRVSVGGGIYNEGDKLPEEAVKAMPKAHYKEVKGKKKAVKKAVKKVKNKAVKKAANKSVK